MKLKVCRKDILKVIFRRELSGHSIKIFYKGRGAKVKKTIGRRIKKAGRILLVYLVTMVLAQPVHAAGIKNLVGRPGILRVPQVAAQKAPQASASAGQSGTKGTAVQKAGNKTLNAQRGATTTATAKKVQTGVEKKDLIWITSIGIAFALAALFYAAQLKVTRRRKLADIHAEMKDFKGRCSS